MKHHMPSSILKEGVKSAIKRVIKSGNFSLGEVRDQDLVNFNYMQSIFLILKRQGGEAEVHM
jgi:hypothetical protein